MNDRKLRYYVCNGKREGCGGSSVCRKKGGCWHTTDIFYALYDDHIDFEPIYSKHSGMEYWELIRDRKNKRG